MKKWNTPEINSISIKDTEHGIFGYYRDGGYLGDHIISGHHTIFPPSKPSNPTNPTDPTVPTTPTTPVDPVPNTGALS